MGESASRRAPRERTSPSVLFHHAAERAAPSPFSPALAPALGALAALLLALGGIGTWIRVTTVAGADPTSVDAVLGRSEGGGWALLVLGVLAAVASVAWTAGRAELRRAAAWAGVLVTVAATWSVVAIDRRAASLAASATDDPSFEAYHAGFGWGAWLLLLAAIAAGLALLVGWLRGIDARRNS